MKTIKLCSQIEIFISKMLIKFAKCEHLIEVVSFDPWRFSPTLAKLGLCCLFFYNTT